MSMAGLVRGASPYILKLGKFNPAAGRAAYNALKAGVKGGQAIARGGKGLLKAAPIVGAGVTALDAYGNYQGALASGEDPGKAAFSGIGSTLGGLAGGTLGSLAGPVGTLGGGFAGASAGSALFSQAYDGLANTLGGGKTNQPVSYGMSPEEQMSYRRRNRRRNMDDDNRTDIAGFRYSPNADTGLVALRMQQQAGNYQTMQQNSSLKHLSNNDLRATLGQQGVDKYGLGQMYVTDRYRAGKEADVMNRQTDAGKTVSLGQQYTERFLGGKDLDNQRMLGMRSLDIEGRRVDLDYGDRREERQARERMYGVDADVRRRSSDNAMAVGALGALSALYR